MSIPNPIKVSLLTLFAGVIYLAGGYQYAKACHAAPTAVNGCTTLELVAFIPALVFTIAGIIGLIVGTACLIEYVKDRR